MRVLHVLETSVPELVGYTVRGRYIVASQLRGGLEPMVVTSPFYRGPASAGPEVIDGVPYFRSNHIPRPEKGRGRLAAYATRFAMVRRYGRYVEEIVRRERPDVIHAHSSYTNGTAAAHASRRTGVPFVYELRTLWGESAVVEDGLSPRSLKYRAVWRLELRVMHRAARLVVISDGIRDAVVARGVDPGKIDLVPNGVDTGVFVPRPADRELAAALGVEGCFVVGFIGSLRRLEGLELLVRAFPRILGAEPRARLLVVGEGPERPRLEALARSLGLGEAVRFTGLVPHDDVLRYYSVMDVLAYPRIDARICNAVTPLKPLEAMAMGKVCIGSDVGGLRELIRDGVTGLLFAAGNGAALAERVLALASDRGLAGRLAAAAQAWVREEREWGKVASRYPGIYSRAGAGRPVLR